MKTEEEFRKAYEQLAKEGRCDMPGSREYERVLEEWRSLICFTDIDRFIVARANADSRGVGREIMN